ncbi:hypothetical protein MKK69_23585 [Methylobacterium sp. J-026]|uniref:hypothetical protein n=1 Tax=Methylobacterium sp. J-026 TaxID=2836624 RepID=UPI001FB9E47B|nr:hypothetical protein [Methylobacterium sp. J-026]MCJ2136994.1 hypothetical protein [Methylobacterium sp. J-026]
MIPTHDQAPTFLAAVRRIEQLTEEIRRDGLAGFERAQSAYTEIRELRLVLDARIRELNGQRQ